MDLWNGNTAKTNRDGTVTITGLAPEAFELFLKKEYGVNLFFERLTTRTWNRTITFYEFFVPEMCYLLSLAAEKKYISSKKANELIDELTKNTWFSSSVSEPHVKADLSVLGTVLKPDFTPLPHQLEFVEDVYCQKKYQMQLNGYLLSLDQGLGKSKCSLFLGAALHKTKYVVIAPLSVVHNVWPYEINDIFTKEMKIWTPKQSLDELDTTTDIVIVNYEKIAFIAPKVIKYFHPSESMVIVDECHNFKDIKAKRTKELIEFTSSFKCQDILLLSGTPVKALANEATPIFKLLDRYATDEVIERLKELNRFPSIMNELLRNRLGMMMYRKLKTEVLQLPPKIEAELPIKIPTGNMYTLEEVKKVMLEYRAQRTRYYIANYKNYEKDFTDAVEYIEENLRSSDEVRRLKEYLNIVKMFHRDGYSWDKAPLAQKATEFEKEIILPRLPSDMKKKFKAARAVVKYIDMKVMGEILGNVLSRLRIKMTCEMITPAIAEIIQKAEKKTILFSSYKDVIKLAAETCASYGLQPLYITGDNSQYAKEVVEEFKHNPEVNPLVASIQVMSTGHTITEANTAIFLNVPFRSVDYAQASDRIYRIGQDSTVYIYKLTLDTGSEPNLSTRMQDIIAWSREQFESIVGTSGTILDDDESREAIDTIEKAFDTENMDLADKVGFIKKTIDDTKNNFIKFG